MRKAFLFLSLSVFLIACEQNIEIDNPKPDDLLAEDVYLNVLMEIQMLDALVYTTDSLPDIDSLQSQIFKEYELDQERFQRSHVYYQQDVEGQIVRLDSALKMLEAERQYILQIRDSLSSANK